MCVLGDHVPEPDCRVRIQVTPAPAAFERRRILVNLAWLCGAALPWFSAQAGLLLAVLRKSAAWLVIARAGLAVLLLGAAFFVRSFIAIVIPFQRNPHTWWFAFTAVSSAVVGELLAVAAGVVTWSHRNP